VHPAASAGATLQAIWFMGQVPRGDEPAYSNGLFLIRVEPFCCSNLNCLRTFTFSKKCDNPTGALRRL